VSHAGASPGERLARAVAGTARLTAERTSTGVGHDDADLEVGTIATDDARGFDPRPLLRALDECGARAVVIGQVAGILHGSTELTGDLDVLWSGDPDEAPALVRAFDALDAVLHDDLVAMRESAGRPKNHRRAAELRALR
jgi:hypothetical protein